MKIVVLTDAEHRVLQEMCALAVDEYDSQSAGSNLTEWERVHEKVNEAK